MKLKGFRNIICILRLLPALVLGAFASCNHSADPDIQNPKLDDISVCFKVVAADLSTRAVDEYGTQEESHVDLDNLKILIFDKDGILKDVLFDNGDVNDEDYTSVTPIGLGMYLVTAKLDPEKYNLSSEFAIVALANWRSSESDTKLITDWNNLRLDSSEIGTLKIDDLKSAVFTLNPKVAESEQPDSWIPGKSEGSDEGFWIPMFGSRYTTLHGYDTSKFNRGNPMPISDVNLVRAFSKIEIVNLDTGEDSPEITSITLNCRNLKGRLMQDFNYTGTTSNVTAPSLTGFDPELDYAPIPFLQDGNTYTIYFPEMEFRNVDARKAICVNLKMHNAAHQKWIYLAPYMSNGLPNLDGPYDFDWANVKRNYIYRYEINSLAFEFIIKVEPWIFGGKVHIPLE